MPMVKTRKPAAERKAQILDEAMRLAADLGPDRMTTQKLADAVGITQAAIFRHFPSKSEIWQAVADRIDTPLPAKLLESDEPPLNCVRAIVRRQFEFIVKTPSIPAILYSRELHADNEALRKQFSTMISRRLTLFSSLFKAAIEAGDLRPDLDPDDAARLVLAFIQGMAMRWSMEERSFDLVADGMRVLELQLRP
ncbi:MAG TPA: TetR family transcriptional regulator [Rhodobacteraceae bacterium]|nr:TetR family transcriptional regulator [Paracoccaceae bacterium]